MAEAIQDTTDYFSLLGLPVSLKVNKSDVKQKYLALSRQFHPDYFTGKPEEEQQKVLEISAALNKALKVFNSSDDTIKYVLMRKGLMQEEEKYSLPPHFLMEMMELNEEAEDVSDAESIHELEKKLTGIENDLYEPVAYIVESYQEGRTTKEELLQVKDYYFKKKYLQRLREQMNQKL